MLIKDFAFGELACTVGTNLCIAMSCSDVYSPICTVQLGKLTIRPGFILPHSGQEQLEHPKVPLCFRICILCC
jgi:hypothetical protein